MFAHEPNQQICIFILSENPSAAREAELISEYVCGTPADRESLKKEYGKEFTRQAERALKQVDERQRLSTVGQKRIDYGKSVAWLTENSRICPHCLVVIWRDSGCNYMNCTQCCTFLNPYSDFLSQGIC